MRKLLIILILLSACSQPANKKISDFMTKETGYADVNGLKMYYELHGTGAMPLVLLHGGGSTIGTTFGTLLPMLAKTHRVVAVELQGHGHTNDRDTAESFLQDARDVAALLSYLKISKADFFGFSNGAQTVIQLALDYPELVNKAIIASAFYSRSGAVAGFFDRMDQATLDNMPAPLKVAYNEVAPDKNRLQQMHDKDKNRMIAFTGWSAEQISHIKGPALILLGDQDIVTTEHGTEMARLIPHSRLVILPGNHGSYLGEACTIIKGSKIPEATLTIVNDFLEN